MKTVSQLNELATLSTVLLTNLDEVIFFSKITDHIQKLTGHYKVLGYETLYDGSTHLIAENGKAAAPQQLLNKGQGLSGYVTRLKRAYYSNSIKRDPIASTGLKNDMVVSELCVPIMFETSVIGTINIQSNDPKKIFSDLDISQINEVLLGLEAPIRNMHLYLMAKNLNRELLSKIDAKDKELLNRIEVHSSKNFEDHTQMIGISKNFLNVVQSSKKIATGDFPVLLEGEHGVGKKILAKKIHLWSQRKGQVLTVSCSAMEEAELDRELFSRNGLMVLANGGTLILDDIGSCSLHLQKKLLRALTAGELITIDTHEKVNLNIRIIATSKVSLKELVDEGLFKEELYYKLNTLSFKIPVLKQRLEDLKLLAEHFLNLGKKEKKILTGEAIDKLCNYYWPGNAHELKNVMERTYILTDGQYIEGGHLPDFPEESELGNEDIQNHYQEQTLFELEKKHIIDTLDHLSGNKTRAAKTLGITVKTLYNKLHSYGLVHVKEQ